MPSYRDPMERFMEKVNRTETCWNWTASVTQSGYGQFNDGTKIVKAHRWAWVQLVGPIPDGLELDHICRVRACVNPSHLRAVTHKQNLENLAVERTRFGSRGTSFNKRLARWQAYVIHERRQIHLGFYSTQDEAAVVARGARLELFTHNDGDRHA